MYTQPNNHQPRTPASGGFPVKPAAPSQTWNPKLVVNPNPNPEGRSGYVPKKFRDGPKVVKTPRPNPYKDKRPYRGQPKPATPKPGKKYVPRNVPERVRVAVERAFPVPKPLPGYAGARAVAGSAARFADAARQAQETAEEVTRAMDVVNSAYEAAYWNRSPGTTTVAPGLNFIGARAHTLHTAPPSGASAFDRPSSFGQTVQIGNPIAVPQNNWLLDTTLIGLGNPDAVGWWAPPSFTTVPNNWYYIRTILDYVFHPTSTSDRYYRSVEVYRNLTGAALAPLVTNPAAFPKPLGAPLPLGMTKGYPLLKTSAPPKPLTRPKRYDEVAIDIPKYGPPRVYPSRPRKPGPKAKEKKGYGKSGVASFAFWAYENTEDWKDWVDIVTAAMPNAPQNVPIWEKLRYMYENPHEVVMADWEAVMAAMAGWFVDETFGAFVGDVNKRANRGVSVSSQTVDMRTNVVQHYSTGGKSPGAFVEEFILAFLK